MPNYSMATWQTPSPVGHGAQPICFLFIEDRCGCHVFCATGMQTCWTQILCYMYCIIVHIIIFTSLMLFCATEVQQLYNSCTPAMQQQCNCCIIRASHHGSARSLVANQQGLLHWCPAWLHATVLKQRCNSRATLLQQLCNSSASIHAR